MTDKPWTREQEAAALARCEAATKGPWEACLDQNTVRAGRQGIVATIHNGCNAVFVASARTDLPAAIRNGQRLRAELIVAWEHRSLRCPCSFRQLHGDVEKPAPWQECTCGLNEALYAPEGE